ncbi:GIY-YIG nuclease family protein [Methylobacterium sp. WL6]|uniref:GIY-YIG nuclease family protein n=1 Tax=Methylobacterium sp. WL6 TaxID=2603901 RepID=UPI0011C88632|nr:GIY-YIG nuclease family protein [Methylobacterium sp. WL6]TXN63412.1 GIY-YIG nuclease family protein [Methylobacterium sp. WL6]
MSRAVYMLASRRHGTLYLGVTNDRARRVHEHKVKRNRGFTATYAVDRLVWYEFYDRIVDAIDREKALKKWRRDWKIRLIEDLNPEWSDLYPTLAGWTGL